MSRRVLVVPLATVPAEDAEAAVRRHVAEDAELFVVAPVSDLSPLQWLANDEDAQREEAAERAERVAQGAGAEVGDSDPVQAIEDALRRFPADEIVVVAPPDDDAGWLESDAAEQAQSRFAPPVTRLTAAARDTRG